MGDLTQMQEKQGKEKASYKLDANQYTLQFT